jgi:gas vesicle protein GvpA/GvpJ/GvpM family
MARRVAEDILDESEGTVLDLLDHLLTKGVTLSGDVTLGVAGVDLIFLKLSSILCAADRVLPPRRDGKRRRTATLARRTRR